MDAPDTRNISLTRGVLSIALHEGGMKSGYVDIGEADKFDLLVPDMTEIELFTSRDGSGAKVKGTITKFVPKLEISGFEINAYNLALATLGVADTLTQTGAAVTDQELTANLVLGHSYFVGKRNITAVTVKQGATTLTVDDDYTVDAARGAIYFPPTSSAVPGETTTADYTYPTATFRRVRGGAKTVQEVSVRFQGDSAEGLIYDCEVYRVLAKPSGNLSLINPPGGNEYNRWGIAGDVLSDALGVYGGSSDDKYYSLIEVGFVS